MYIGDVDNLDRGFVGNMPLPGQLDGIDISQFWGYWNAIKDKIGELRNLPHMVTQHAMKLGIAVTNLKAKGRHDIVDLLQDEIRKVNDDLAKAWKVRDNIEKYLPEWTKATMTSQTIIPTTPSSPPAPVTTSVPVTSLPNVPIFVPYRPPTVTEEITGWVKSWFGGGGVQGLGVAPMIALGATAMAALAYVVTQGMALWQDYSVKMNLTQAVIEGKLTSGQASDIAVTSKPSDPITETIKSVGVNVGTIAGVGLLGYLALMWFMNKK